MQRKHLIRILWLLLLLSSYRSPALAAEAYHSLADITHAVEQHILKSYELNENTSVEIGQLDPRLRLRACGQPLEAFFPQGSRNSKTTVGVRCPGPHTWTIYVSASIRQMAKVLVARTHIRRGTAIQAADFELKEYDLNRLQYGYYTDLKQVSGQVLKRHLNQGAVLTPAAVAANKVVKRGEGVSILAETGGITIRAKGEALESGGIGDIIRVKNLNSNKEIEARITGPGQVKVDL